MSVINSGDEVSEIYDGGMRVVIKALKRAKVFTRGNLTVEINVFHLGSLPCSIVEWFDRVYVESLEVFNRRASTISVFSLQ